MLSGASAELTLRTWVEWLFVTGGVGGRGQALGSHFLTGGQGQIDISKVSIF